jgi:hypothetical protein
VDFEFRDERLCDLREGNAWFRVAKGDEGFSVLTPRVEVTDLGTEFGLLVAPDDGEVHVGTGKVRISSRHPGVKGLELEAPRAVKANAIGHLIEIPYDPRLFLKDLPSQPRRWHWSFDEDGDDGGYALSSARKLQWSEGRWGRALDVKATGALVTSDFSGILGDAPRTIAVWIKGEPIPRIRTEEWGLVSPTVVGWGAVSDLGTKWDLVIYSGGSKFGTQWGGSWMVADVPKNGSVLDGRWHHLVSVFTGQHDANGVPEIFHYLDGEPLPSPVRRLENKVNTQVKSDSPPRTMIAGFDWRDYPRVSFPWSIDELYILPSPLSPKQVRVLYERNEIPGAEP